MEKTIHHFYKKAAWLAVLNSVLSLIPVLFSITLEQNPVLILATALIAGLIVSLLIALAYSWMKWVMLALSILSLYFVYNDILYFYQSVLSSLVTFITSFLNILITVMLFIASKRQSV